MRTAVAFGAFLALALLVTTADALDSGGNDTAAKVVVAPVASVTTTWTGQPITLPQKDVQVLVSTYDIPAGATLPVHEHPFPRYAYVLAGTLQVTDTETGKSATFHAGDFVVETIGRWHQGTSVGPDAVKLLVIDQVEQGTQNTILRQ